MATRIQYVPNPSWEVDLFGWDEFNPSASTTSWVDDSSRAGSTGKSLRVNNAVTADYGRMATLVLPAGTYSASCFRQSMAGLTNACFVVRKADYTVLVQKNWAYDNNNWNRTEGSFTLTSQTTVQIIVGVGSYGAASAGSCRFDRVLITSGASAPAYFDGSFTDTSTVDYSWESTPHRSRSLAADVTSGTPPTSGGGGGSTAAGWDLVFQDNFEGTTLNSRWAKYVGPATNGDGDWAANRINVANGLCTISGLGDVAGGMGLFPGQLYGAFEVCMRYPDAQGYKPVGLLWPDDPFGWPEGELDFAEANGNNADSIGGYVHDTQGNPSSNVKSYSQAIDASQFHVYRCEWVANRVTYFIDGVQVLNLPGPANGIPTHAMHLVLQLDIGVVGSSLGIPVRNGSTPQPYNMEIDWVKVYSPSTTSTPSTPTPPPTTSTDPLLASKCNAVWEGIKRRYIRADGGVRQREADDKITSEGTGYAEMVAVQVGDRDTFDRCENFAVSVLERRNWQPGGADSWRNGTDNDPRTLAQSLMAWDYRPNPYAGNPSNTVFDWNFATDADVDRAKALYWAAARWNDVAYLNKALEITRQIELFGGNRNPATGKVYQVTDEYQQQGPITQTGRVAGHHDFSSSAQMEINVSYVDLAFYHLAKDRGNNVRWDQWIAGGLDLLQKVSNNTGDSSLNTTAGLFPDWNGYDFGSDDAYALTSGSHGWNNSRSTDYKYDAFRTVHRLRWAYDWYQDAGALALLQGPIKSFYVAQWTANSKIAAEYSHTGSALSGGYEKPMMTAGAYLTLTAGDSSNATAAAMYAAKLKPDDRYSVDAEGYAYWNDYQGAPFSYFADFWLEMFYLRQAGLWNNWGQTAPTTGGNAVEFEVTDVAGSSDDVRLVVDRPFSVVDLGGSSDDVSLPGPVAFSVVDSGGSNERAELFTSIEGDTSGMPPVTPPRARASKARYQWVGPFGGVVELTDYVDGADIQVGVSGRGAIKTRRKRIVIAGKAGRLTTNVEHDDRELKVPLHLKGRSIDQLEAVLGNLIDLMDPADGEGVLRYIDRDYEVFELHCRCVSGLEFDGEQSRGPISAVPTLGFEADDPYWYGRTITQGFGGADAPNWFPWAPIRVGSSTVLGEIELVTNTKVKTQPVWTIVGPGRAPVLRNQLTGETIEFGESAILLAGQRIVIDTDNATVEMISGDVVENWFPRLRRRSMWPLRPGYNKLEVTMAGVTDASYVAVAYRDKVRFPYNPNALP